MGPTRRGDGSVCFPMIFGQRQVVLKATKYQKQIEKVPPDVVIIVDCHNYLVYGVHFHIFAVMGNRTFHNILSDTIRGLRDKKCYVPSLFNST